MPIHYSLIENPLTSNHGEYTARVRFTDSVDLDAIVRRITEHGSTSTEASLRAMLIETIDACESFLLEGNRVNLGGLCELYPRISGVFQGVTDHFDPARHRVDVGASPGSRVRNTVREEARVEKVETIKPTPAPLEYEDLGSGEVDSVLTPGNIGTLNGHRLKFDPASRDEGIFLLPGQSDGKAIKIALVQKNKPSQLIFLVPADLPKGNYRIEVRARIEGGKELRAGRADATLRV
uniref:DNA-binding domain-containing protein n=1 Tax=Candidatus Kentrum sp. MB TaxID=2138164 RepID=A0A450XHJ6_9GAMM|nr:MAG: DNA-binding domain-containing protein [Candidatus Kentron sp. MB]VFK28771.1 MAG: DNA-binding domain-containing protein [Candidatus Kentron sp. MB]VFK74088.1 MAG: DNA-binding domain-containing protein [Candidatus Kentron sp. MB]